jgi:hypothetical protein
MKFKIKWPRKRDEINECDIREKERRKRGKK